MKTLPITACILALWLNGLPLSAQTTTYRVVTKKIEKSFPYRNGYEVNIDGEKAEVTIESWDRQEIGIILELSAKHPDRNRAEADLEAMRYQADRVKNSIYLRNYLSPEANQPKPESVFTARYTIHVPKECPVYLKNRFGEAKISDLANRLRINSEFTRLGLQNIQGMIDVYTRFGDLEGSQIDGAMTVNARRANLTLREIKGALDITAQYGILRLFADQQLTSLRINADKSEVFLFSPNPQLFAYSIQATHSDLRLPNELEFKLTEESTGLKKATFRPRQENFANITITITFGELSMGKK